MLGRRGTTHGVQGGFTLVELLVVIAIIAIIAMIMIPNLSGARIQANEAAAVSTLRSIASAQSQVHVAGAIDTNNDGVGEYGYLGELSGGAGLRDASGLEGPDRLRPPALSTAFGDVVPAAGVTGGIVRRSGYTFQTFLPAADASGIPEGDSGGVGPVAPNATRCESFWCCYAWPTALGKSGRRAFFVNQRSDVLSTTNTGQGYDGAKNVPQFSAAFEKGAGNQMGSSVAANTTGGDMRFWKVVN